MPRKNQRPRPVEQPPADRPSTEPVEGDMSLRDQLPDPGSYQSNHGTTGYGGDDERADPDDAKVQGQSRD